MRARTFRSASSAASSSARRSCCVKNAGTVSTQSFSGLVTPYAAVMSLACVRTIATSSSGVKSTPSTVRQTPDRVSLYAGENA